MVHIFCPKPVRVSSSHSHPRLSRSPSLSASHNKPNSATSPSPSPSHSRRLSPISHPQSKPSSPSNADLSPSDDREMLPATPPPSRLSPPFLDGLALDELLSILSCPLPSSPSPVSPYSSSGPAPILLPPSRTGSRTGARRSVGGGGRRRSTGQGDPRTRGASPTTPGIPIGGRYTPPPARYLTRNPWPRHDDYAVLAARLFGMHFLGSEAEDGEPAAVTFAASASPSELNLGDDTVMGECEEGDGIRCIGPAEADA